MEFLAEVDVGGGPLAAEREVLLRAAEELVRVATGDVAGVSREQFADTVTELVAATERASVAASRFVAVSESEVCGLTKGAASMTALLNRSCRVSRRRAKQFNLVGTAPDRYPHFYRALLDGRITAAHIEVLHPVYRAVNLDHFQAAERNLAGLAAMCTPEEFGNYLTEWRNCADENAALDEFLRQQAKQHLVYGFDVFGNAHITGTIGPVDAEAFINTIAANTTSHSSSAAMDALVDLVLNPDGKKRAHLEALVPEQHGPEQHNGGDPGNDPEPQSDSPDSDDSESDETARVRDMLACDRAMREQANQIRTHRDTGFSARYWPRTARGTLIPPAIITKLINEGARVRYHTVKADGTIAGDTSTGRWFTTEQKRLIRLRDHHCQHPGCCNTRGLEYDHIQPWHHHKQSLISNAQLLCKLHHRYKHRNDSHGSRIFDDSPIQLK